VTAGSGNVAGQRRRRPAGSGDATRQPASHRRRWPPGGFGRSSQPSRAQATDLP